YMEKKAVGKYSAGIQQSLFKLKSNTDYTIRAYIKTNDLKGASYINHEAASLYVTNTDAKNELEILTVIPPGTNGWLPIDMVFKTGNISESSGLSIRFSNNATGGIWVDDVRLIEGIHPITRIFARKFSNGLILLKPPNYYTSPSDETTAYKLKLDGKYRRLLLDGSRSDVIEEISLNDFDAAILVPEPVEVPPPDGLADQEPVGQEPAVQEPAATVAETSLPAEQSAAVGNQVALQNGVQVPPKVEVAPEEAPVKNGGGGGGGCSLVR
ncbi:MAG: hypothetical protein HYY43_05440, partial [Deltaproteobacteria bacterium]|nr:hypothetical protein [Deltaproteobacteria bacterium]